MENIDKIDPRPSRTKKKKDEVKEEPAQAEKQQEAPAQPQDEREAKSSPQPQRRQI